MSITPEEVNAGQSIYTKQVLAAYDFIVLSVSNHLLWKCPTQKLLNFYNQYITANHLDVGVGTAYFLDRCQFPSPKPHITLMDLNSNALEFAARRIARYNPETCRCNVLNPIVLDVKYDSVSINYLLHCLPGSIESKSVAFDHLKALMNPNAVVFGSTLLRYDTQHNWLAKRLMDTYNKRGIFSNQQDDLEGLERSLNQRFKDVSIEIVGCAVLFSGRI